MFGLIVARALLDLFHQPLQMPADYLVNQLDLKVHCANELTIFHFNAIFRFTMDVIILAIP